MNEISKAREVFNNEIAAIEKTRNSLNGTFEKIIEILLSRKNKGKIIVTGIGKTGHIAAKVAATLSSLGSSAFFMNAAEAMHGDLGLVESDDVIIVISKSGESEEIKNILPSLKLIGATIIALTNRESSTLALNSDIVYVFPPFDEACNLNLAPTSSTTAALVLGDAIAVVLSERYGFSHKDFGLFHPGGLLGKRLLLKVSDVSFGIDKCAVLNQSAMLTDAISAMCKSLCGLAVLINDDNSIAGVVSDGDIRRQINEKQDIYSIAASNIMTKTPKYIDFDTLAVNALDIMNKNNITAAPIVKNGKFAGVITIDRIIGAGLK
ncbi:MAG: KpsF/GutQ family sugar-phosphate isomerase [Fibromonadaceae bacterium]|jgi:arabinose-5-phosphate isomerase|nr:KpsF/GutQ family sugar-phosphate isomerase [Fibromonadaceae bacterium]